MPNGKTSGDQALISEGSSKVLFRARSGKLQGGGGRARSDIIPLGVVSLESVGVASG